MTGGPAPRGQSGTWVPFLLLVALPSVRDFSSRAWSKLSLRHIWFSLHKRECTPRLKALMTLLGSHSPLATLGSWGAESLAGRLSTLREQGEKGF